MSELSESLRDLHQRGSLGACDECHEIWPCATAMVLDEIGASTPTIDTAFLERQRDFSQRTFGPGLRTRGVTNHIRSELEEIEAEPQDLFEWVDVILLALDGALRAGHEPATVIAAIRDKQARNEQRAWPDWRDGDQDTPLMHVR